MGQELAEEDAEKAEKPVANTAFDFTPRPEEDDDAEEEDYEAWGEDDDEVEEVEISEMSAEDKAAFNKFFPEQDPLVGHGFFGGEKDEAEGPGTNLADLILEKIAIHEAAQAANGGRVAYKAPGPVDEDFELPEKVVEVYAKYVCIFKDEV